MLKLILASVSTLILLSSCAEPEPKIVYIKSTCPKLQTYRHTEVNRVPLVIDYEVVN